MLNKTILVFYINVGQLNLEETNRQINSVRDLIRLEGEDKENTIQYVIPVRDEETRVECINNTILVASEEMKKERIEVGKKFVDGCIKNGLTEQRAKHLWNKEILGFISYGFSKNHAIPYSYNSFQCAYLLTYHEKEWVKACLESDPDLQETINNVRQLKYEIAKPDINQSSL